MKKIVAVILVLSMIFTCVLNTLSVFALETEQNTNSNLKLSSALERKIDFNEDWKFSLTTTDSQLPTLDDSSWRSLNLPHDFSIEFDYDPNLPAGNEVGLLPGGTAWYRKTFILSPDYANKKITIDFGGVYKDSTTYVNGTKISDNIGGYIPFSYDITNNLVCDGVTKNVIAVKVVNRQPSGRWYSGSGIYRNVNLTVTDKIYVKRFGTFVTTPNIEAEYESGAITVNVKTDVSNETNALANVFVRSTIEDATGKAISEPVTSDSFSIAAKSKANIEQNLTTTQKPTLWESLKGAVYYVKSEVLVDENVVDTYYTRFGFRWVKFTNNDGFYLNGEYLKLLGMCMHHDQGALGSVASYRAIERQMEILIGMGVNAIRVTHNPAADELIEICERLGILVIDEGFDGWIPKKTYDYDGFRIQCTHPEAPSGITWAEYDVKQMVLRGRNSPAIIMWSLGNEVGEAYGSADQIQRVKNLNNWVKEVDPTRPTTMGNDKYRFDGINSTSALIDSELGAVGLNYGPNQFDALHDKYPNWIMFGSETSSATKSRGEYAHPDTIGNHDSGVHPEFQQSSYDNDHVGWGSSASTTWAYARDRRYILGEFIWTGFDYIGEPTPWHNNPASGTPKSSFFGVVDLAGFPKDDYYLYESQWTSVEENPMVHILPHWNWDDAAKRTKVTGTDGKIPVRVYSNAKKVELFVDGVSKGEKEFATNTIYFDEKGRKTAEVTNKSLIYQDNPSIQRTDTGLTYNALYLEWRLPYEGSEIKAVAKDAQGNIIAEDIIKKSGTPAKISLTSDRQIINADGYDLSYITVDILDAAGNINPLANNMVTFTVSGNAKIVGVDNGNATTYERHKDYGGIWKRSAFNGKALVIVQSTKQAGSFTLTATSPGLASAKVIGYATDGTGEKVLLGYNAPTSLVTEVNVRPTLPQIVEAIYSDGTSEQKTVTWNTISEESLSKAGVISVKGLIDGKDEISITVIVKGVSGISPISLATAIGEVPNLPATVQVIYNDGTTKTSNVTWGNISQQDVSTEKTFIVEGTVEGTALKAKASIRVAQPVTLYDKNVAVRASGATYPKANGSYQQSPTNDPYSCINDGRTDNRGTGTGRWTTWPATSARKESWVSLEFENPQTIGSVDIDFFTDSATQLPEKVVMQYSIDGENFINVSNQSKSGNFTAAGTWNNISFDPVELKFIRFNLTAGPSNLVGIVEVKVNAAGDSAIVVPNKTALLNDLKLNGETIKDFDPTKKSYVVEIPYKQYDGHYPEVAVETKDNAAATIIPALPSSTTTTVINVVSEDKSATSQYTIQFIVGEPKLDTATLTVNNTNPTEDDIVPFSIVAKLEDGTTISNSTANITYNVSSEDGGQLEISGNNLNILAKGTVLISATVTYDGISKATNTIMIKINENTERKQVISYAPVYVLTDKGKAPVLPETVKATFDVGLPRDLAVVWDEILPSQYAEYGTFEVKGTVIGQILKPTAIVEVKGITAVQNFSAATPVGKIPNVPVDATVYLSDGTTKLAEVNWGSLTPEQFNSIGTVVIEGSVDGTDIKSKMTVRVSNEATNGRNVALMWNGSIYPLAIASWTNDGAGSSDRVSAMNDGAISFTDSPQNRWTNWTSASSSHSGNDWVGIMFADAGARKMFSVDNMVVSFFEDSGVSSPKDYVIQYYNKPEPPEPPQLRAGDGHIADYNIPLNDDANWSDVTGHEKLSNISTNAPVRFDFDMVRTHALRIKMTRKDNKRGLAVSEIEVMDKVVPENEDFELEQLIIDGVALSNVSTNKLNYSIKDVASKIEAKASKNASVTVVILGNVAKIIVTPEDGNPLKAKTYTIQFSKQEEGLKGDTNGDEALDLRDVLLVLKIASGSVNYDESKHALGDVTGDGKVELDDAQRILNKIVKGTFE